MIKEYTLLSKAWYGKSCLEREDYVEEISLNVSDKEGFTIGQCSIEWYILNGDLCPKIQLFSDAWKLFEACNDLFLALSRFNNKDVSIEDFIKCLKNHGFKDVTPLTRE